MKKVLKYDEHLNFPWVHQSHCSITSWRKIVQGASEEVDGKNVRDSPEGGWQFISLIHFVMQYFLCILPNTFANDKVVVKDPYILERAEARQLKRWFANVSKYVWYMDTPYQKRSFRHIAKYRKALGVFLYKVQKRKEISSRNLEGSILWRLSYSFFLYLHWMISYKKRHFQGKSCCLRFQRVRTFFQM